MDREQRRMIYLTFIFFFILFFFFIFSGCFLITVNSKDFKKPLVKSINIDSNDVVTIVLDNTNKTKPIGKIHNLVLFYHVSIFEEI